MLRLTQFLAVLVVASLLVLAAPAVADQTNSTENSSNSSGGFEIIDSNTTDNVTDDLPDDPLEDADNASDGVLPGDDDGTGGSPGDDDDETDESPGDDDGTDDSGNASVTELYDQLFDLNVHSVEFVETDAVGHAVVLELTWTGGRPETVTVTQLPGDDANRVAISRYRLLPGERTEVTVDLVDDSPALLYSDQSLERGRALALEDEDSWLIDGPWSATDAQITGAAGLLVGLGLTTLLAFFKVSSRRDEPERVL